MISYSYEYLCNQKRMHSYMLKSFMSIAQSYISIKILMVSLLKNLKNQNNPLPFVHKSRIEFLSIITPNRKVHGNFYYPRLQNIDLF